MLTEHCENVLLNTRGYVYRDMWRGALVVRCGVRSSVQQPVVRRSRPTHGHQLQSYICALPVNKHRAGGLCSL